MNKNNIQYSVLSYYPSFIGTENIQVGVAFFNLDTRETRLELTSNWGRVKGYDDELDMEMFRMLLMGIKDSYEKMSCDESNYLYKFIRFYVNELKFTKVFEVYDEDFNSFIERTKKIYLKFDYETSKRMTKDEQLAYLKQLIKGLNVSYRRSPIVGEFEENLNFDYVIDSRYAIKIFNFKEKDLNRLLNTAKAWAYTAQEVEQHLKVIFIIDNQCISEENKKSYNAILQILSKSTKYVFNMSEGLEFISTNLSDKNQQVAVDCT